MLDWFTDFFRYRFPAAITARERYYVYVSRNRCLAMFVLGIITGALAASIW